MLTLTADATGATSLVLVFPPASPSGTYTIIAREAAVNTVTAQVQSAATQVIIDPSTPLWTVPADSPLPQAVALPSGYLPLITR